MVPQWNEISPACRASDYVNNKTLKRSLKRARGGLVVEEKVLPYLNAMLTCAGFDEYTNPGTEPVDNNPFTIAGMTITRAGIPGNGGTYTVTGGPANAAVNGTLQVIADPASGPFDTTVNYTFSPASTADDVAAILNSALDTIDQLILDPVVDGMFGFSLSTAGMINQMYINGQTQAGGGSVGDGVYGPYTQNNTQFWIQKDGGVCYVWFDIDADPSPDIRMTVEDFLADENNDLMMRQAVQQRAQALGCG